MNELTPKVLLKELLDFKNEVESIDKYPTSQANNILRTEYYLKDLVSRLKRYQLVDSRYNREGRKSR